MLATELPDLSTDQTLVEKISGAMRQRLGRRSDSVEISANDGQVTLHGIVHSYYEKQLSLAAAKNIAGVRRLHDEVMVLEYPIA